MHKHTDTHHVVSCSYACVVRAEQGKGHDLDQRLWSQSPGRAQPGMPHGWGVAQMGEEVRKPAWYQVKGFDAELRPRGSNEAWGVQTAWAAGGNTSGGRA